MGREQVEEGNSAKKKTPGIIVSAGIFSVVWIGATAALFFLAAIPDQCDGPFRCMQLNELGDFIAGASAPLAFLWLVVAVFIQANELAEQREELRLTRREFELNRDVMKAQAEDAKQQAGYIGKQTELMALQAEDGALRIKEEKLTTTIHELGSIIRQYLYNKDVLSGVGSHGQTSHAQFTSLGRDSEEWILEFAKFLLGVEARGIRPPIVVISAQTFAMTRVYELARVAVRQANELGGHSVHRIQRLRIQDILGYFRNVINAPAPNPNDDTVVATASSGFRLPRPSREINEDDPDAQST